MPARALRALARAASYLAALGLAGCTDSSTTAQPEWDGGTDGGRPVIDGGGTVPDPPDGANACPQGACNYQSGAPCTGGDACLPAVVGSSVAPTCQGAGDTPLGAACTAFAACEPGALCVAGRCRKLCCGGDWSACPTGESCYRALEVRVANVPQASGAEVCYPVDDCDPFGANTCPAGQACGVVDPVGHVGCISVGTGEQGDPCSADEPCSARHVCAGGECRKLCHAVVGDGSPCTAYEACVFTAQDPPGLGQCVPY